MTAIEFFGKRETAAGRIGVRVRNRIDKGEVFQLMEAFANHKLDEYKAEQLKIETEKAKQIHNA